MVYYLKQGKHVIICDEIDLSRYMEQGYKLLSESEQERLRQESAKVKASNFYDDFTSAMKEKYHFEDNQKKAVPYIEEPKNATEIYSNMCIGVAEYYEEQKKIKAEKEKEKAKVVIDTNNEMENRHFERVNGMNANNQENK